MVGKMSVVRGAWEPGVEEGFPQVWAANSWLGSVLSTIPNR